MAAWDSWTQRRGMLGWGSGSMLPEATGGFDGVDSQLFLALPGQYEIENGEIPEPEPEPEAEGGRVGPRRKTGIGR
jgi:hypothetical protein